MCVGEFYTERNLLQLSELIMMFGHEKLLFFIVASDSSQA